MTDSLRRLGRHLFEPFLQDWVTGTPAERGRSCVSRLPWETASATLGRLDGFLGLDVTDQRFDELCRSMGAGFEGALDGRTYREVLVGVRHGMGESIGDRFLAPEEFDRESGHNGCVYFVRHLLGAYFHQDWGLVGEPFDVGVEFADGWAEVLPLEQTLGSLGGLLSLPLSRAEFARRCQSVGMNYHERKGLPSAYDAVTETARGIQSVLSERYARALEVEPL